METIVFLSLVPYLEMLNHSWILPTLHQNNIVNTLSHFSERFIAPDARRVGANAHGDGLFELVFPMSLRREMIYLTGAVHQLIRS